jgi:regulator of cell morphogenesis and NO signaling
MRPNREKTIGELAAAHPAALQVLEKQHIDYYSDRNRRFQDACRMAGSSAEEVLRQMARSAANPKDAPPQAANPESLEALIQHLEDAHHRWLQKDLPWIAHVMERVESAGTPIFPLRRAFGRLRQEFEDHMRCEENVLFPAVVEIERSIASGGPVPRLKFGSLRNPIAMLEQDHERESRLWDALRDLTYGYVAPEDASETVRLLYGELKNLEAAAHLHTHLEENVLFPRVVRLARQPSLRVEATAGLPALL